MIILAQVLTGRVSVRLNAVAFRPERLVLQSQFGCAKEFRGIG